MLRTRSALNDEQMNSPIASGSCCVRQLEKSDTTGARAMLNQAVAIEPEIRHITPRRAKAVPSVATRKKGQQRSEKNSVLSRVPKLPKEVTFGDAW